MKHGFFSKNFPLPEFLKLSHVGISFSDSNIKAIFIEKNSDKPILKSSVVALEKGAIVSGRIINAAEVVKKLTIIKKEFNTPYVFFAIPDELAFIFSTSVIVSSRGNASESVAFVIEENVPLTLADTVFDFAPFGIEKVETEYSASVVVAACVRKEVDKFISVLRESGFDSVGCIPESQAIARALLPTSVLDTNYIIHVRDNRVGIYLIKKGLVFFATLRTIADGDYKKQFLDEYDKFLEYRTKYDPDKDKPVKSILVCGEFEYAKEIVELLINSKDEAKNVKLSNVWTNVFEIDKYLPNIPYEKSLSLAGPIGAALSEIT